MNLSFGFSPCPNDTFMFGALALKKIDTKGYSFNLIMEDIENLNRKALHNELDILKVSFGTYAKIKNRYKLLPSGSALGYGNGPLLISTENIDPASKEDITVAIPGENTTANMLLNFAYPKIKNKIPYLFSDIEQAVIKKEVNMGVIIHENRFTYQQKGLKKIADLGALWEEKQHLPIPLGGIVIKNDIPSLAIETIGALIKKSILYAYKHRNEIWPFIKKHAQEMDNDVINKHIELYVNDFSVDLGDKGKKAVSALIKKVQ